MITQARSSNTMFNKRDESRHPCLAPDLRGNTFSFLQLIMMLAVGLMYIAFISSRYIPSMGFPGRAVVENSPASAEMKKYGFDSWVRKSPWSRKWQPSPVFLLGKFHGQGSLAGYSLVGYKESDMTEHTACLFTPFPLSGKGFFFFFF